jgi:hypothetical protein
MVAVELPTVASSRPKTSRANQVTIERRRVTGKQLRFNWDEKETTPAPTIAAPATAAPATELTQTASVTVQPQSTAGAQSKIAPSITTTPQATATNNKRPAAAGAVKARVGEATKLGVVMLRLLKSYGITDEEIIEGLSMPTVS